MGDQFETVVFQAGDVLFLEGDLSENLYILDSGTIEVIKDHKVIGKLSEPGVFFGEMAFLLKQRRTATLRALTTIRAKKIPTLHNQRANQYFSKTSMSLLKALAARLDLANEKIACLESYKDLYFDLKKEVDYKPHLNKVLNKIEQNHHLRQQDALNKLLNDYLKTPWVWLSLEQAVKEMVEFYTKTPMQVDSVELWESSNKPLGSCSSISFSGDRDGVAIVDLSNEMSKTISEGMGLNNKDKDENEISKEMSNLILGNLKKKMTQQSIIMDSPKVIETNDELIRVLGDEPALKISCSCNDASINLIYQLALTNK
jgi:CRP-like cAMP-binding protein/CheY-specific phosphatase CheX